MLFAILLSLFIATLCFLRYKSPRTFGRIAKPLALFGCALLVFAASSFIVGCSAPTVIQELETVVPIAEAAIVGLVAAIAGFSGSSASSSVISEIQSWATKISQELAQINTLIGQYKSNPGQSVLEEIESILQTTIADLGNMLTIAGVPAALQTKIQGVANLVLSELQALLSVLQVFKDSTAGATLTVIKPLRTADFKAQIHKALSIPTPETEEPEEATSTNKGPAQTVATR